VNVLRNGSGLRCGHIGRGIYSSPANRRMYSSLTAADTARISPKGRQLATGSGWSAVASSQFSLCFAEPAYIADLICEENPAPLQWRKCARNSKENAPGLWASKFRHKAPQKIPKSTSNAPLASLIKKASEGFRIVVFSTSGPCVCCVCLKRA
jgi:hypothetical protein